MWWQVDFRFHREGDRVRLVEIRARVKGFRWWWPVDWLQWIFRGRSFHASATPAASVHAMATPGVGVTSSIIEPPRWLPNGTRIRAAKLTPLEVYLFNGDRMFSLDKGAEVIYPGDRGEPEDEIPF